MRLAGTVHTPCFKVDLLPRRTAHFAGPRGGQDEELQRPRPHALCCWRSRAMNGPSATPVEGSVVLEPVLTLGCAWAAGSPDAPFHRAGLSPLRYPLVVAQPRTRSSRERTRGRRLGLGRPRSEASAPANDVRGVYVPDQHLPHHRAGVGLQRGRSTAAPCLALRQPAAWAVMYASAQSSKVDLPGHDRRPMRCGRALGPRR